VVVLVPKDDMALQAFLGREKIPYRKGPLDDVRERYRSAAQDLDLDIVIRATADNPAVDPEYARLALSEFIQARVDLFSFSGMPIGTGVEIFSTTALMTDGLDGPEYREHVSLHIKHDPSRFKVLHLPWSAKVQTTTPRLTVDTPEDLQVIRSVFDQLGDGFRLADVLRLFENEPGLFDANRNVSQVVFKPPGEVK